VTPATKDEFAKLMMDRIHRTGEKGEIVNEPEEFCLRGEGKAYRVRGFPSEQQLKTMGNMLK